MQKIRAFRTPARGDNVALPIEDAALGQRLDRRTGALASIIEIELANDLAVLEQRLQELSAGGRLVALDDVILVVVAVDRLRAGLDAALRPGLTVDLDDVQRVIDRVGVRDRAADAEAIGDITQALDLGGADPAADQDVDVLAVVPA